MGARDGPGVGKDVGDSEAGAGDGADVGTDVGKMLGADVGEVLGADVGTLVGMSVHPRAMQAMDSCILGHAAPPAACCSIAQRIRVEVVAEHGPRADPQADHVSQSVTTQSIGHPAFSEHGPSSAKAPHDAPPKFEGTATERIRRLVPMPQVVVQAPHAVQLVVVQSVGQISV